MIRWILNVVSIVSLLLLVAVLGLWVRGYWATDHFWLVFRDGGGDMVRSSRGRLTVRHVVPNARTIPAPKRISHWSCPPESQLPPKPSPLHWEKAFLVYEGTPGATKQELATARLALKEAEAGQLVPKETPPADPEPPAVNPSDPQEMRWYINWLATRNRGITEQQRLRMKRDSAWDVLNGTYYHEWTFPAWLAAGVLAILPCANLFVPAYRRRMRRRRGQCAGCGYDVRASKDRCPECGRPLDAKAT
jgi:hypothetical protein